MPPNIVFVIADQHRWDFVGYEDARTLTPELDRLAAAGAVVLGGIAYGLAAPQRRIGSSGS